MWEQGADRKGLSAVQLCGYKGEPQGAEVIWKPHHLLRTFLHRCCFFYPAFAPVFSSPKFPHHRCHCPPPPSAASLLPTHPPSLYPVSSPFTFCSLLAIYLLLSLYLHALLFLFKSFCYSPLREKGGGVLGVMIRISRKTVSDEGECLCIEGSGGVETSVHQKSRPQCLHSTHADMQDVSNQSVCPEIKEQNTILLLVNRLCGGPL